MSRNWPSSVDSLWYSTMCAVVLDRLDGVDGFRAEPRAWVLSGEASVDSVTLRLLEDYRDKSLQYEFRAKDAKALPRLHTSLRAPRPATSRDGGSITGILESASIDSVRGDDDRLGALLADFNRAVGARSAPAAARRRSPETRMNRQRWSLDPGGRAVRRTPIGRATVWSRLGPDIPWLVRLRPREPSWAPERGAGVVWVADTIASTRHWVTLCWKEPTTTLTGRAIPARADVLRSLR